VRLRNSATPASLKQHAHMLSVVAQYGNAHSLNEWDAAGGGFIDLFGLGLHVYLRVITQLGGVVGGV
jgi:hypothetical protein